MNMDLSWSPHLKVDAPTIVKNLRNEVKKHMEFISSNMSKFDNVNFALNEGQTMLRGILCRNCRDAVKSKRLELHSKNEKTHKKKNLKKLSQERQQIVNEITNNFIQLERSQNEDEGDEEYCTEEEYYRQELLEMESMYTNKLFDKQDEMREIEKKCKKEVKDKEAELRKVTIERDDYKKRNDSMSIKLKSFDKTESELRELKKEHKQLKENLDRMEYNIRKLKRELEIKEEDNERYRSSFQRYRKGSSAGADSRDEELQRSRRDNENLKLEQIELIGSVQDENRSLKEKLERKVDELHSMKSQLEVLQKAKRKQIAMGLWKERSGMGKTMVDMITKELMRSVGGQLGRDNIDLTIRPCKTTSDISGSPLLVLCLNMSRIGTNIQDAIEGIQADKTNVFVLVLHHTSMDNLSSLTPTSLRVTGSELRKLGGIIDMAFSSDSGLYECDLNNNAAEKITSIMRKYMTA
ncbi:uncharacterized protein LOC110466519 isoform X2 [Mizuhopecten yessoensis]|uniref:uncharacterized protein LOC110466519 isoform X2 n=1 Tax=Mizuhopecten yessoensis TaxID=6573 RepID=UPI000B459386|nr:uncharacterized protein LOC110466519 isoform X2 [Mizuhopecten yessoensis]